MIIYNVTVSVEESVQTEWLNWMRNKHIPEVMACGIFTKAQISKSTTCISCRSRRLLLGNDRDDKAGAGLVELIDRITVITIGTE